MYAKRCTQYHKAWWENDSPGRSGWIWACAVSGASSRTKIVDIDTSDPGILAVLLAAPSRLRP